MVPWRQEKLRNISNAIPKYILGVARGMRLPMEYLRFLILIPIPFKMPQLFDIMNIVPWLTHFFYRFYSMMMITTVLGLILAMVHKPRTWCTICPIATASDVLLKKGDKDNSQTG